MSNNWKVYHEKIKGTKPNKLTEIFLKMNIKPANAIDIGCGVGRDTIALIKNKWKVLAIDGENTEELIRKKLSEEEQKNLEFSQQKFENLKLKKVKLIISNFSLSFCNKEEFQQMWKNIENNIEKEGYFVGNFFGTQDSWATIKKKKTFLTNKQVEELFKNKFEIIKKSEIERDGTTVIGNVKHWHIHNIIAKKIKN